MSETNNPTTNVNQEIIEQLVTDENLDEIMEQILIDDNYVNVIETVISSLDQNATAMVSETSTGHLWKFSYGSVEVFVQLTGNSDDDTLTVWSVILPVKESIALMIRLLELNWSNTLEAKFAISDNQILVVANRTVAELSPGEISRAITLVATLADNYDDSLKAEFSI